MIIKKVNALQILDSRGNPTISVQLTLNDGSKGKFQVPSGASTGIHEAMELRDNNPNKFLGKSVEKAIQNINEIRNLLYDIEFTQESLDNYLKKLDGTKNKSKLGANAILGISTAFAKASAEFYNMPLYSYLNKIVENKNISKLKIKPKNIRLFANIINGGLHAGNNLQIQEFMIVPNLNSIDQTIQCISEIYQNLKIIISERYGTEQTSVGDEGGFAPSINKPIEALELIMKAIKISGYENKVGIALDAAASDFYDKKTNKYEIEKDIFINYKELTEYYNNLTNSYPIISIEDPFGEDDFDAWKYYRKKKAKLKSTNFLNNSKELIVVGDDLLVTNPERIKIAQKSNLCNSLLLKINQIGTISESLEAFRLAKSKKWITIVSHRSGETIDSFIADLAIALNSPIKIGAPARGERVAKYNRLLEISESNK